MRILHVTQNLADESSGPSYTARLCRALSDAGSMVELFTIEPKPDWEITFPPRCFPTSRFPHPAWGRSSALYRALQERCRDSQIIHSHLLWTAANIYPEFARRGTACKHVISPRGTLSPWALRRSRLKKWISMQLGERRALDNADMFHATAAMEYEEIRALGFRQPVAIIPNGIDLPPEEWVIEQKNNRSGRRKLLFLGRLHPKKGIHELLTAWKNIEHSFPSWELEIVGPLDAYGLQMKEWSEQKHIPRVSFPGELNGTEKLERYAAASLFVLPTHSENFGMTVAEALACRTPVVTTVGTPWEQLEHHSAGCWIEIGAEPLESTLRKLLPLPQDDLDQMGENGRKWMDEFSWDAVGARLLTAYEWLLHPTETTPPEWVMVD